MVEAVDVEAALAALPVLKGRRPDTPAEESRAAFAQLAEINNGAVFAGSFEGESAWERHRHGDELVQILRGRTRLTVLTPSGRVELDLEAGMLTVVPRGCWHRFRAPDGVTVLTATPQPTDMTAAAEPPDD